MCLSGSEISGIIGTCIETTIVHIGRLCGVQAAVDLVLVYHTFILSTMLQFLGAVYFYRQFVVQ